MIQIKFFKKKTDKIRREVGFVLKDFENVAPDENLALRFLDKFAATVHLNTNRGTLAYQQIITAIFNEKFHEFNEDAPA